MTTDATENTPRPGDSRTCTIRPLISRDDADPGYKIADHLTMFHREELPNPTMKLHCHIAGMIRYANAQTGIHPSVISARANNFIREFTEEI